MSVPGKVRIIAGNWRGRKLEVIDSPGLRPSPDRIRETLFNWLQQDIVAARCLDLFAGSGAIGFEALSRGAREVVMIESDQNLVENLKRQAEKLNSTNHIIQQAEAIQWLTQQKNAFDIIFLDPPFAEGYIEKCCAMIREQSLLADRGMIYIESEKDLVAPAGWTIKKQTRAGEVKSALLELD
ncbi:MAG: 16S rRNA (guanine(966)-N(2))-methyltransferase RsmD [Proteobacteria bacterium]|nr:16S rRNA (guanine(966)-N(2))-methyltransferase RsmD [Pseudomonadota bacterium]